jgi:glycolate oxidase FAD binding subunit
MINAEGEPEKARDPKSCRIEIPGAVVEQVYEPEPIEDVGAILEAAARERASLLITGGRTRLHWAELAPDIPAALSMCRLSGVDQFEPEEGVLHVSAGTPVAEIRSLVRAEGWELPLDSPGLTSTVGGTVASAVVGPRAQAFGRVSDAILGLDLVGADGVASKCGGRVVKNVTGYDLAKLYCGSFGTLAVITGAWLRLRPMPAVRRVFSAGSGSGREAFEACRALTRLTSVRAWVWNQAPGEESGEVVIELGGSEEGVAHDRDQIATVLKLTEAATDRIDSLRDERAEIGSDEVVLRARVLGTECEALTRMILCLGLSVSVDPGLGAIHARGRLDSPEQLLGIRKNARAGGGFATFEVLPHTWREGLSVFDDVSGSEALTASLKNRFDPAGILNPGRSVARL